MVCPVVVVPTGTNGQKVRICVDYTELNKVVQRRVHPMANVDDMAKFGTGKYVPNLDANSRCRIIPSLRAVQTVHDVFHVARTLCVQSFIVRSIF